MRAPEIFDNSAAVRSIEDSIRKSSPYNPVMNHIKIKQSISTKSLPSSNIKKNKPTISIKFRRGSNQAIVKVDGKFQDQN